MVWPYPVAYGELPAQWPGFETEPGFLICDNTLIDIQGASMRCRVRLKAIRGTLTKSLPREECHVTELTDLEQARYLFPPLLRANCLRTAVNAFALIRNESKFESRFTEVLLIVGDPSFSSFSDSNGCYAGKHRPSTDCERGKTNVESGIRRRLIES